MNFVWLMKFSSFILLSSILVGNSLKTGSDVKTWKKREIDKYTDLLSLSNSQGVSINELKLEKLEAKALTSTQLSIFKELKEIWEASSSSTKDSEYKKKLDTVLVSVLKFVYTREASEPDDTLEQILNVLVKLRAQIAVTNLSELPTVDDGGIDQIISFPPQSLKPTQAHEMDQLDEKQVASIFTTLKSVIADHYTRKLGQGLSPTLSDDANKDYYNSAMLNKLYENYGLQQQQQMEDNEQQLQQQQQQEKQVKQYEQQLRQKQIQQYEQQLKQKHVQQYQKQQQEYQQKYDQPPQNYLNSMEKPMEKIAFVRDRLSSAVASMHAMKPNSDTYYFTTTVAPSTTPQTYIRTSFKLPTVLTKGNTQQQLLNSNNNVIADPSHEYTPNKKNPMEQLANSIVQMLYPLQNDNNNYYDLKENQIIPETSSPTMHHHHHHPQTDAIISVGEKPLADLEKIQQSDGNSITERYPNNNNIKNSFNKHKHIIHKNKLHILGEQSSLNKEKLRPLLITKQTPMRPWMRPTYEQSSTSTGKNPYTAYIPVQLMPQLGSTSTSTKFSVGNFQDQDTEKPTIFVKPLYGDFPKVEVVQQAAIPKPEIIRTDSSTETYYFTSPTEDQMLSSSTDNYFKKPAEVYFTHPTEINFKNPTEAYFKSTSERNVLNPAKFNFEYPTEAYYKSTSERNIGNPTEIKFDYPTEAYFKSTSERNAGIPVEIKFETPTEAYFKSTSERNIGNPTEIKFENPTEAYFKSTSERNIGNPTEIIIENPTEAYIVSPTNDISVQAEDLQASASVASPSVQVQVIQTHHNKWSEIPNLINGTKNGVLQFVSTIINLPFSTKFVIVLGLLISIVSVLLGLNGLGPPILAVGILGFMIPIVILILLQDERGYRRLKKKHRIDRKFVLADEPIIVKLVQDAMKKYEVRQQN